MKNSIRRMAGQAACTLAAACLLSGAALAQAWPSRPITLVVPSPAGGGTDILGRTLAHKMSESLGQPVVVENKAGASGIIGVGYVARQAPADGYTLLLGALGSLVLTPNMYARVPFDARTDFAPVSLSGRFDFVLVTNPQMLSATNLKELVEAARKEPKGMNYASPAPGTMHHLTTELFARQAGVTLVPIQYKGGAPAMQDVMAGHVPMMFLDVATALPHIRSGKLRALAVTSDKRIASLPAVPTVAESGYPGFIAYAWQGVMVRAGTPPEVVARLAAAHTQAMADPAVREKLVAASVEPMQSTPAEFAEVIRADHAKWSQVIKAAGISAD
ncbi:MAG: tripartite tricarboxylate transporter substrate binding protein [Ramlibacter sp.]